MRGQTSLFWATRISSALLAKGLRVALFSSVVWASLCSANVHNRHRTAGHTEGRDHIPRIIHQSWKTSIVPVSGQWPPPLDSGSFTA
jgi:hypothetical protein